VKLSQVPNFRVEDFASEQSWIGRLFINLNPFIQAVNQLTDQNVDFSTNIKAVTKSYDITTFQAFSFKWPFTGDAPVQLQVVKALKGNLLEPTLLMASWSYDSTTNSISVVRMVEINATSVSELSGRYQFTLRVTV
jgi:hypothetical protein